MKISRRKWIWIGAAILLAVLGSFLVFGGEADEVAGVVDDRASKSQDLAQKEVAAPSKGEAAESVDLPDEAIPEEASEIDPQHLLEVRANIELSVNGRVDPSLLLLLEYAGIEEIAEATTNEPERDGSILYQLDRRKVQFGESLLVELYFVEPISEFKKRIEIDQAVAGVVDLGTIRIKIEDLVKPNTVLVHGRFNHSEIKAAAMAGHGLTLLVNDDNFPDAEDECEAPYKEDGEFWCAYRLLDYIDEEDESDLVPLDPTKVLETRFAFLEDFSDARPPLKREGIVYELGEYELPYVLLDIDVKVELIFDDETADLEGTKRRLKKQLWPEFWRPEVTLQSVGTKESTDARSQDLWASLYKNGRFRARAFVPAGKYLVGARSPKQYVGATRSIDDSALLIVAEGSKHKLIELNVQQAAPIVIDVVGPPKTESWLTFGRYLPSDDLKVAAKIQMASVNALQSYGDWTFILLGIPNPTKFIGVYHPGFAEKIVTLEAGKYFYQVELEKVSSEEAKRLEKQREVPNLFEMYDVEAVEIEVRVEDLTYNAPTDTQFEIRVYRVFSKAELQFFEPALYRPIHWDSFMLGDSSIVRRKFALDPRIYHYVEVVEPTRLAGYADYALGNSGLIKFDGDGVLKLSIDHSPRFAKRESEFDTEFFCEGRKLHFESYPRPEDVPARSTKLAPRGVNTRFGYSEFQRVGLNTLRAEIAATLEVVFAPDVLSAFQIKYVGGRGDNPAIYLEETLERLLVPHLLLDQMDPGELRLGVGEGEDASLIKQRFEPAKDGKLPRIVFYLD